MADSFTGYITIMLVVNDKTRLTGPFQYFESVLPPFPRHRHHWIASLIHSSMIGSRLNPLDVDSCVGAGQGERLLGVDVENRSTSTSVTLDA